MERRRRPQGRDLDAFAHAVFCQALADGLSHILVDYRRRAEGATLADKAATGARPYLVHIRHDQILGCARSALPASRRCCNCASWSR